MIEVRASFLVLDGLVSPLGSPLAPRPTQTCPTCQRTFPSPRAGRKVWCSGPCAPSVAKPRWPHQAKSQARRRAEAASVGLCSTCCVRDRKPGFKGCDVCIERRKAWRRSWQAAAP